MKKNNTRDYAVEAFRFYSKKVDKDTKQMNKAELDDIAAVEKTLSSMKEVEIQILKTVYFEKPNEPIKKNEISARISKACLQNFISEKSAYGILQKARKKFSVERVLRM